MGEAVAIVPGQGSGLWPTARAALWATVASAFRILAFIVGAWTLMSMALLVASIPIWLWVVPAGELPGNLTAASIQARLALLEVWFGRAFGVVALVVVAYLGMQVPVRTARKSVYSIAQIRRWIAVIGFVVIGLVIAAVPLTLDIVTAILALLTPVVFAIAVLRGPTNPPLAVGWRPYLLLSLGFGAVYAGSLAFVILSRTQSVEAGRVGLPSTAIGIATNAVESTHHTFCPNACDEGRSIVWWPDGVDPSKLVARVQTEIWPVDVRDDSIVLGAEPLVVGTAEAGDAALVDTTWATPIAKSRQLVAFFAVGVTPDGRRIVLGEPDVQLTPGWRGTVLAFFLGG